MVENGKVYVNGGFFNRVYNPVFPAALSIAVVALIEVSPEEFLKDHRLKVEMEDASGEKTDLKIEGGFRVAPSPEASPGESAQLPVAVPLTGLSLPRAGDYWFVLSIDDDEISRTKVSASQVGVFTQAPPPTPTGGSGGQKEE